MSEATEVLWPATAAWPEYNDGWDTDRERAALAALTVDEARVLAERATQVLETSRSEQPYDDGYRARIDSGEFLIQLVCHVPNVLQGLYDRLLDAGVLSPDCSWSGNTPLLFCDAGPAVRDRLIAEVEAGPPGNAQIHEALAWIGDDVVREVMGRWADARNRWYSPWLDAGWELFRSGRRGDLYQAACYRLEPGDGPSPVRAVGASEEPCGGCGQRMTTALDVDLADPLWEGDAGERLTITTCESCVYAGTVHVTVDLSGRSVWHEASDRSSQVNPEPIAASLRLGEQRPRPFTGLAFGVWDHPSQFGGFPAWVQNPTFPDCPRCGNRMPFLAQLGLDDLGAIGQGTIYVFCSPECGHAATLHQQT